MIYFLVLLFLFWKTQNHFKAVGKLQKLARKFSTASQSSSNQIQLSVQ